MTDYKVGDRVRVTKVYEGKVTAKWAHAWLDLDDRPVFLGFDGDRFTTTIEPLDPE